MTRKRLATLIEFSGGRGVMAEMSGAARVLIVDDQPNIVDMLATVLRFNGFDVSAAHTAAAAVNVPVADPTQWIE